VTRRRPPPIHIEVVKRSAYVTGAGAWAIAEELEIPRMKCRTRKVLMIPANRVDEYMTHIRATSRRSVTVEYPS
jgi:hypothetical protein